ncbi:hypothetical protein Vadar_024411 [Vaccinium darrowii]|uniref:Uncharacterized protein n=1 Tax=Vaccinium darrowii TaxID=229202 RepID=A0ACB7ZDK5_9ERIC|nr:hypothetical protein Vadar_024411 [Vaccinium darrowii]
MENGEGRPTVRSIAFEGEPTTRIHRQEEGEGLNSNHASNLRTNEKFSSREINCSKIEEHEKQNLGNKNGAVMFASESKGMLVDVFHSFSNKWNQKLGEKLSSDGLIGSCDSPAQVVHRIDPPTRTPGNVKLFIKNIDTSVTSTRLKEIFCKFETLQSCKVTLKPGKKGKCYGYVMFASDVSSMLVCNSLHGTILEGKKLFCNVLIIKDQKVVLQKNNSVVASKAPETMLTLLISPVIKLLYDEMETICAMLLG